jgi:hypothetical protein
MDSPVLELHCSPHLDTADEAAAALQEAMHNTAEFPIIWDPFTDPEGPVLPPGLVVTKPRTLTHRNVGVQTEVRADYLPMVPDQCWRCGQSGHSRESCRRAPILFCSRCGKVGTQSRDCPCRRTRSTREAQRRQSREPSSKRVRFQDKPLF